MQHFKLSQIFLGGPGVIVKLDESYYSNKSKHHHEQNPDASVWVFEIVERSTNALVGYIKIVKSKI